MYRVTKMIIAYFYNRDGVDVTAAEMWLLKTRLIVFIRQIIFYIQ